MIQASKETEVVEMKEIIEKLEKAGYYVCNQFDGFFGTVENEYELYNQDHNLVADNLTESDLEKYVEEVDV
jgi:hypothetical protein